MMGRALGALDMVSSERCAERYPRNDSLGRRCIKQTESNWCMERTDLNRETLPRGHRGEVAKAVLLAMHVNDSRYRYAGMSFRSETSIRHFSSARIQ